MALAKALRILDSTIDMLPMSDGLVCQGSCLSRNFDTKTYSHTYQLGPTLCMHLTEPKSPSPASG
jgi:hypothetical protein